MYPQVVLITNSPSRTCLKSALTITGESTDNHLRCLVLALISSHFMHTATDYAMKMLGTCEQLASGLGAGAVKGAKNTHGADTVGNIPLRIWTAERVLGDGLSIPPILLAHQRSQNCIGDREM